MISPDRKVRAVQAAGVVLVLAAGIWAGARVHSGRYPPPRPAAVKTTVGEASPPLPSDRDAPTDGGVKIPERLPEFSLADRYGKITPIARWAGKSLVLNFWATWCAPCRREIPLLQTLNAQWSARGIEVVGIAVDYREKVDAYASQLKIAYPLLVGEQDALDVAAQLGVEEPVFPFTAFTDKRGEVVTVYVGELHPPQAGLILTALDRINTGTVDLAAGRRQITEGLRLLAANRPD